MNSIAEILSEVDQKPSLTAYAAAARRLKQSPAGLAPFRLAILANHTFDIETVLFVECARRGFEGVFYQAGYDQYRQELLNPESGLDRFQPDAVLISLHLEHTIPELAATTCAATAAIPEPQECVESLRALFEAYRRRSAAPVFVHDFIPPATDMDGVLSASRRSLFDRVMEANAALRRMAESLDGVYVIGAAKLACSSDLASWRDSRMSYLARAGINPKRFPQFAALIARHLSALRKPAAKCLVLDLDNTLWGGILGDVGPEGILCADGDYPANAYADFQRAVLSLRSRGILIAIASKNDASLVEEAFKKRANMPLGAQHISDWEVHWDPKPESLQRIAQRLNIGLDSLVFLDDNPAEIDLVKMALPQVRAYLMPARPEEFAAFLASLEDFDQLKLSAEDLRRADLYEIRKKQAEMAATATDLESFYRSLKTVLTPEAANDSNFERIVQLIQKTNQFNLTTRRHDRLALNDRLAKGSELWAFRASDVHGDHGIISVALLDFHDRVCVVDTLLMSCRVIGRTLETAILSFVEERGAARGASKIEGEYLPTEKNGLCRDFYKQHGFDCVSEGEQRARWAKDLTARTACPEWISLNRNQIELCAKI